MENRLRVLCHMGRLALLAVLGGPTRIISNV
jgi:hypothetical protein